jgi:Asp-tRNA(Asn)/Glu-tRNA(Gln) amidotransferase A subunit family amidase
MTNVSRTSAIELATRIKQRDIPPVEVLDAYQETIAAQNSKFKAIAPLAKDKARLAAKAETAVLNIETLGAPHGLAAVINNVTLAAGIRTTYGSPLYKDFVPVEGVEVVARLRRAVRQGCRETAGRPGSAVLRAVHSRPVQLAQRCASVGSPAFAG